MCIGIPIDFHRVYRAGLVRNHTTLITSSPRRIPRGLEIKSMLYQNKSTFRLSHTKHTQYKDT